MGPKRAHKAQPHGAADSYYSDQQPMQYQMQESQGYGAPQQQQQDYTQAPPNYGQNYGGPIAQQELGGDKLSFDQTFKIEKPKWNDVWAGVLLILVFFGFVAVSAYTLHGYSEFLGFNGGSIYDAPNSIGLNTNTVVLFAFVLVVAFVFSWGYITLARLFTKAFIWVDTKVIPPSITAPSDRHQITGILHIVFGFVTAIYMLIRHYWSGGIVFLLFAIFTLICFISWIKRIPFSVLMLQTSIDVSKSYGHVYLVSLIGGFIATAFGAWFSVTLVAIYAKFEPGATDSSGNPACASGGNCSTAIVIGLIVYITFSLYWLSEWIKNTIHVTISGIYGAWYFLPHNPPKGPTRGAFRRAMTYSFGSIAFGSLVVAIIQALRQLCSIAQNQSSQQGDFIGAACSCFLGCLLGCLEWAIEFLNRYAFCNIALYGKAYIPAAKDTWQLIKNRGIDALINECLVGPVLTMGATFVGFASALLAYLYLVYTDPAYNRTGDFTPVVLAFAFLVGLQIAQIFTTPISSGIDTIFVAMAFDPQVLMNEHPELWAKMIEVYPHVQQAVRMR